MHCAAGGRLHTTPAHASAEPSGAPPSPPPSCAPPPPCAPPPSSPAPPSPPTPMSAPLPPTGGRPPLWWSQAASPRMVVMVRSRERREDKSEDTSFSYVERARYDNS